jgi:hypothetical protein
VPGSWSVKINISVPKVRDDTRPTQAATESPSAAHGARPLSRSDRDNEVTPTGPAVTPFLTTGHSRITHNRCEPGFDDHR